MWSLIQTVPNWSARAALQRAADVARPHRRGEAVRDVVRPRERLGVVGEALHGHDRAEHLALDDLVGLADAGDDGRLDEEAAGRAGVAAGEHRRAGRALEEAEHALLLGLRDHRPHLDLVARRPGRRRAATRRPGTSSSSRRS